MPPPDTGYWEPHTASIDFCEENYLASNYIVEIHNVWSSLLICGFGLLGYKQTTPIFEPALRRFQLYWIVLALTGLGSSLLHGTLHWLFQSADELPMVYGMLNLLYCLLETDHHATPSRWKISLGWAVACCYTLVYYCFQHLYWVFVSTYGLLVAYFIFATARCALQPGQSPAVRRIFVTTCAVYLLIASTSWVFDMMYCDLVVRYSVLGLTPHIVWHFCAAFGGYGAALFLFCLKCQAMDLPILVDFWWGVVPLVSVDKSGSSSVVAGVVRARHKQS